MATELSPLDLIIDEAVSGRNYYTNDNYYDETAVSDLCAAINAIGKVCKVVGQKLVIEGVG